MTLDLEPDLFPILIRYTHHPSTCVVTRPEQIECGRYFEVLAVQVREIEVEWDDPPHHRLRRRGLMKPHLIAAGCGWYLNLDLKDEPVCEGARAIQLHPNLVFDLDANNQLVGIQCLGPVLWPKDFETFWSVSKAKEDDIPEPEEGDIL